MRERTIVQFKKGLYREIDEPSGSVDQKNISDINLIIDDLIIWMKKHPHEFDPIVKRLIFYSQNSLTSKVVSRSDNRIFELYLLFEEEYRILKICLIEDYQFSLLIHDEDRNDFRSGSLERNVDNSLKSFSIAPYPVTEKKVSEFYQLFFSWWHQAKQKK